MLVLTPKYGSQIDLDLLKKQKDKTKEPLITHRQTLDLNEYNNMKDAYLVFLKNKDKYIIGYKPKNDDEICDFVESLGEIDTLDVGWIDVSLLNSLVVCFTNCKAKHIIGLEKWDVSRCTNIHHMFSACENLESISDISGWDVSKVTAILCMFNGCENLKTIDISGWDVSSVKDMSYMFADCKNLSNIGDISGWDVRNVRYMDCMFYECENLKSVGDLDQWDIKQSTLKYNMFLNSAIKPTPSWYTK